MIPLVLADEHQPGTEFDGDEGAEDGPAGLRRTDRRHPRPAKGLCQRRSEDRQQLRIAQHTRHVRMLVHQRKAFDEPGDGTGTVGTTHDPSLTRPAALRDTGTMADAHPDDARPRITLDQMVADAKARIEELTVEQLQAEIEAGDVTVIDIRDVRERWEKGAIPGAKSMPRGMLEFWFAPESPYFRGGLEFDRRYVLHCAGGQRSALAAAVLQDLGYTDVAHLEAGFNGWKAAGAAVEQVEPDPKYYPPRD